MSPIAPPGAPPFLADLRWWPWNTQQLFARMRAEEADLMQDFLLGVPAFAVSVCYDVQTGPVGCELGDCDPQLRAVASATQRCRIDALAWDGSTYWIIELKPYALPLAVGQLLTYHCLLTIDDGLSLPCSLVLVCRAAHQGAINCAGRFGIPIAIVPPAPGAVEWLTPTTSPDS